MNLDKIKVVDNFIDEVDSKYFIDYIDKNFKDETRFRHRVGVAYNKGLAVRAVFPDEKPASLYKDLEQIVNKYSKKFIEYVKENYQNENLYFYGISITKLSKDIQLRIHQDIHNDFSSLSYSCVMYLNEDYSGGEVVFLEEFVPTSPFPLYNDNLGGLVLKPKSGQAFIFPSAQWHGGKRILDGNKYAIILWLTPDKEYEFEGFDSDKVLNLINYKK